MFQAIVGRAQYAIQSAVAKYVLRAAVAVPFVVGLGFGIAALDTILIDYYGHTTAYLMLAGAFMAIGIVAAGAIAAFNDRPAPQPSALEDETGAAPVGLADTAMANSDLLISTFGIVGPKLIPAIPVLLRFIVRNWALVVSIVVVVYLLLAEEQKARAANPIAPDA